MAILFVPVGVQEPEVCNSNYVTFLRSQEISVNKFEAIKAIYGPQSGCLRGPWYDMGGTGLNLHRTCDPVLHAKQRPLWEQGFKGYMLIKTTRLG
jgi:hypothetical protein